MITDKKRERSRQRSREREAEIEKFQAIPGYPERKRVLRLLDRSS